ncbi:MAG: DNA mismatch repair protein MutS [Clostridia bacterium]|nr:DNA mismatch repair protein MutS [Clostridia bacterium]
MAELSPMMKQYLEIKEQNKDCIIFFRLGDFYEMFFDDAKIASKELELALTGRDCGLEERAPMCGVPYHSCDAYIARMVEKGYKIAICEQMEDPATAKGIVKRGITRIITPGTVIEDSMLDESRNSYLACVVFGDDTAGLCFVDSSTGQLDLTEMKDSAAALIKRINAQLGRYLPREVILCGKVPEEVTDYINHRLGCRSEIADGKYTDVDSAKIRVEEHFFRSIDNLGIPGESSLCAIGAVLEYLYATQRTGLEGINKVNVYSDEEYMKLDVSTRSNLELTETMRGKELRGSLLWVLDKTETAMGKRLIRSWIEQPLINLAQITSRQNGVAELYGDSVLRGEIAAAMDGVYDIQRLMTRVLHGTVNPREIKSLAYTIGRLPEIKALISGCKSQIIKKINDDIGEHREIFDLIEAAIVDDPPAVLKDGNVIRSGYNAEVDSLRIDKDDGHGFIARIEAEERERTGIKNLKIKYNKVFGYYIEVTNSYKDLVPPEYIRKQTTVNAERYITESLKTQESRVLGAQERLIRLETELFDGVRLEIARNLEALQCTAAAIARLDALCSLAKVAANNNYVLPDINQNGVINIKDGRHPVVEAIQKAPFVPNDTLLDNGDNLCAVITGPNMAGKSTYMRQVAVITLMAQIGSFVPARSADISICDAIFTRVGASDDLASGQSTFMVEMSEVAHILKNATKNSLIIFDEIGRGTSTFDGMAIAQAVLEFVCDRKKIGAKTLFATHYHELTQMEETLKGVINYNTSVKKRGDDITFLRKIVRGGADGSYGIEVAKLAGIPENVIKNAKNILHELEENGGETRIRYVEKAIDSDDQIGFTSAESDELINEMKTLDVNVLTPIEAMQKLWDLVNKAKNI